jgi:tRNA (guanine26-N2/guanine27-N2)-dimethyltransferase
MQNIVQEGKAKIKIYPSTIISKKMEVFYNPAMKLNRDISVLLLNSLKKKELQIALPLAGTGIRGIRFLLELKKGLIKNIHLNDANSSAVNLIKSNLKMNKLNGSKIQVTHNDANQFLLQSTGFDYIDIDPFGTPNPFLDCAVRRLSRRGILAVTATDTSALAGSHPKACKRKYWARPLKNEFMHETGIRILIRKIQLIAAQYERALTPIFVYSDEHYYRVFLKVEKGKQKVDACLKDHNYVLYNPKTTDRSVSRTVQEEQEYAGPLWTGKLWDPDLVEKMYKGYDKSSHKLIQQLELIKEESKIDSVGFYDLHKLAKIYKKTIPKIEDVLGPGVSRTHFLGWGIRTTLQTDELPTPNSAFLTTE